MAKVIAFANQKGGVAKTTTTLNLAVAFAEQGNRVLCVDMDPQGNLTMSQGIDPDTTEKSMYDVLVHDIPITEVIQKLGPRTVHVEVKDERGRAPDHEFLIPGEGECDYVPILKALDAVGYDGHVAVEISIMVQRRPDYDPLAAAEQSYRVLARAFDEAGIQRTR